jgi:hypothetical protein
MGNVFHLIKLAASVCLGVAGLVCLFVAMPFALPLFVGSICFSVMPE